MELLSNSFFIAIWKLIIGLVFTGVLFWLFKRAADSWKKSGTVWSIADEIAIGIIAFILVIIIYMTPVATILGPVFSVVIWVVGLLFDVGRAFGLPI